MEFRTKSHPKYPTSQKTLSTLFFDLLLLFFFIQKFPHTTLPLQLVRLLEQNNRYLFGSNNRYTSASFIKDSKFQTTYFFSLSLDIYFLANPLYIITSKIYIMLSFET